MTLRVKASLTILTDIPISIVRSIVGQMAGNSSKVAPPAKTVRPTKTKHLVQTASLALFAARIVDGGGKERLFRHYRNDTDDCEGCISAASCLACLAAFLAERSCFLE